MFFSFTRRPAKLIATNGTLYMIAPESLQEVTRPLFAGLLAASLVVYLFAKDNPPRA